MVTSRSICQSGKTPMTNPSSRSKPLARLLLRVGVVNQTKARPVTAAVA
jgi:hypothetical protein